MSSHDDNVTNRPSALDVVRRLSIMKTQYVYVAAMPPRDMLAKISAAWSQEDRDQLDDEFESRRREIVEWLRATGLWEHTSPSERVLFEQSVQKMTDQQSINVSWSAEAICCFAWALQLWDAIPAYDTQVEPQKLLPLIKFESLSKSFLLIILS